MSVQTVDPAACLAPTRYLDFEAPELRGFVAAALEGLAPGAGPTATAVRLFERVRDGLRYDPYTCSPDPDDYRASAVARAEAGFCVPKAILLAACLRAAGVPAALGFADVRNHLTTPKLAEAMGTDLFLYHGYVQLWAEGRAFKVTPAFDMGLCERFGVRPLVFDGTGDALFHEFDARDRRHMEYVRDRGLFAEAPVEEILAAYRAAYPRMTGADRRRGAAGRDAGFAPEGGTP